MRIGIDLGSTTTKVVIIDRNDNIIYKKYVKHNGYPIDVLLRILETVPSEIVVDREFSISITGSAGMGLSERAGFDFIQEVIALSKGVRKLYPNAEAIIEIGGEDAKFVYFSSSGVPEMRMNGSCAGGTGSFIDQMRVLLDVSYEELDEMAKHSTEELTIASRCGVFAKTDVQALLNQGKSKNDIAWAIFKAVALQYISTLIAGVEIKKDVIFAGGPLNFYSQLIRAFKELLKIGGEFILPKDANILVAYGAALSSDLSKRYTFESIIEKIRYSKSKIKIEPTLDPLFTNKKEYEEFKKRHEKNSIAYTKEISKDEPLFMGIDAGSTTTKLVIINEKKEIVGEFYKNNEGDPIGVVKEAFKKFKKYMHQVKSIFVTGYGEELIKQAFKLNGSIVETFAHYRAGLEFNKDIDFILDIGGQDIKAIKIVDGFIENIELNEACSSGTGSFIETFSKTMGFSLDEFVEKALFAKNPIDLGTRCTVFMNSKVKDALRDGYSPEDIAAGLSYSVVKNALYKVIRITDISQLGENILVQGGTFKNDAVLRAFEKLTGKNVIRVKEAHIMGAYGSAIYALEEYLKEGRKELFRFDEHILKEEIVKDKKTLTCKGCGNFCNVTMFIFNNGRKFYTGNKCERFFTNQDRAEIVEPNFFREKYRIFYEDVINDKTIVCDREKPKVGIPLVLEIFEHFPFYYYLFKKLGFRLEVSHWTTESIYQKGITSIVVDNICLPAKVVHGHIVNLIEKNVDFIFYPLVQYEEKQDKDALNAYNCPVVTGYPVVIDNVFHKKIKIEYPTVSFVDRKLLFKSLQNFFEKYGVKKGEFKKAFDFASQKERELRDKYLELGYQIIEKAKKENKPLIIIAGRPYHIDPFINKGIFDIVNSLGGYAISEEVAASLYKGDLSPVVALTQWTYHNRMYKSVLWARQFDYKKVAVLQVTSFGCGPDAVTVDEMKGLAREGGILYMNIKIDEMVNLGAVKIRLKSLFYTLNSGHKLTPKKRKVARRYNKDKDPKVIIAPYFQEIYNEVIKGGFERLGYKIIMPEKQTKASIEEGLKYVNNDMCYPAIIAIGDIIYQLKNLDFKPSEIAVGLTETGGQCRASNYSLHLKKAIVEAGFGDIPVAVLNTAAGNDDFKFNKLSLLRIFSIGFNIADAINRMKLSTRPYEKNKGTTDKLVKELSKELQSYMLEGDLTPRGMKKFLKKAVNAFNDVDVYNRKFERVGIVGEIYLKTNDFSNNFIIRYLENKGYEVEQPGFIKFLESDFFSVMFNLKNNIRKEIKKIITTFAMNQTMDFFFNIADKELQYYKRYRKEEPLKNVINENIITMAIQCGEAWLLPLEISVMAKKGIKYIISLQPWGCISNHIIAKGMVTKIKEIFPDINFTYFDYESSSTNVNIFNRLELFLSMK